MPVVLCKVVLVLHTQGCTVWTRMGSRGSELGGDDLEQVMAREGEKARIELDGRADVVDSQLDEVVDGNVPGASLGPSGQVGPGDAGV